MLINAASFNRIKFTASGPIEPITRSAALSSSVKDTLDTSKCNKNKKTAAKALWAKITNLSSQVWIWLKEPKVLLTRHFGGGYYTEYLSNFEVRYGRG